ncbi:hypothetical protein ACFYNW_34785 [Streptomyces virginiae]|uniref:hypothetical protein n=1 Tax=Streptomyces virginiae TaxID=1961 RepID=UPI0036E9BF25
MDTARTTGPLGKASPSGFRRTRNSLFWAVLVAGGGTLGGFVSQFPWMLYVGVLVVLAAAGLGAAVAGSNWNRAGAAAIVGFGTMALGVFAGSNLNEAYMKLFGERVSAVVLEFDERTNVKGDVRYSCRVVDTAGERHDLGAVQNCRGQVASGEQVVMFKDRIGALDPWLEKTGSRALDPLGLGITGALLLLVGGTMFTAGRHRRSDRDLHAEYVRRHGPPWRS